jgi:hypothetical protein
VGIWTTSYTIAVFNKTYCQNFEVISCMTTISNVDNDTYERGFIKKLGEYVQFFIEVFGGWWCFDPNRMANA